jgi:DNA-binding GntR family transcriptional regulator
LCCDRGRRREAIVTSLLADVFQGRLRAGGHLVTQELAERFGVSHTPVREALISLAGIGVIDLLPNRGAVVRRVTPQEVREVCQVRRALECEATRCACGRIDLAELHALAAALRRLTSATAPKEKGRGTREESGPPNGSSPDSPFHLHPSSFIAEARAVDNRLHDLIADSCGNAFLAKELGRLKILFRAFRDVSWEREEARNDYHRLAEESHEHLAIVEGLLAGDRKAAARAMARHIRSGARYWSRALPAQPPAPTGQEPHSRRPKGSPRS